MVTFAYSLVRVVAACTGHPATRSGDVAAVAL